jgi:hypothetical protein
MLSRGANGFFVTGLYRDQRLNALDFHGLRDISKPLVLLHQKVGERGLIQATLADNPF